MLLSDWVSCPVCQSDESDVEVTIDFEHIRLECGYCGSAVKVNYEDA